MKKSIIITLGALLIVIVLAVWAYLLFFGTPESSDEVFSDLGFGSNNSQPTVVDAQIDTTTSEPNTTIDNVPEALRQLTIRPVAGFAFVGTSTSVVRYVERGTGHVYEVSLVHGEEQRLSSATIPRVVSAIFSPSGESIAYVSEEGAIRTVVAGKLSSGEDASETISLPVGSFDPHFVTDNKLQYGLPTALGVEGYEVDIRDGETIRIFTTPFTDISLLWNDDVPYLYNTPANTLRGGLYKATPSLTPVIPNEYNLVAGITNTHYLASYVVDTDFQSYAFDRTNGNKKELAATFIPEKCASNNLDGAMLWCASPIAGVSATSLMNWYMGTEELRDYLWYVDIEAGSATLLADFLNMSGRLIDVDHIVVDTEDERVLLRNKIDNTLWLYDRTIQ